MVHLYHSVILRMYKYINISLLIIAHLILGLGNSLIYINYQLNTGIYEVNCENKNKPQLRCKGKCQMAKQMQEQSSKDKSSDIYKFCFIDFVVPAVYITSNKD